MERRVGYCCKRAGYRLGTLLFLVLTLLSLVSPVRGESKLLSTAGRNLHSAAWAKGQKNLPPLGPVSIVYCEYLPFYFQGGKGELRGIFVDFWKLWSEKTGMPVTFSILPWEASVEQVKEGKIDMNAAVFYTPERDTYLDFSLPFFDMSSYLFYHAKAPPLGDMEDLSHYRFGAVNGDFSAHYLKEDKNVAATAYVSHERLVKEAIHGKVDAFIMEAPVAMTYIAKHNGLDQIKRAELPLYTQAFHSGVHFN